MKRLCMMSLLIAIPACSGDDSKSNGAGGDASATDDSSSVTPDTGSTEDTGTSPDVTVPSDGGGADADAGAVADASDGAVTDASDGGCPTSWTVAPVTDPAIAVPDGGGGVLLHALGTGTQDYVCKATTTDAGTTYAWTLVTPDAVLADCHGMTIGHHFASEAGAGFPEWQTTDGTYVIGQKKVALTPDGGAGAIPWLLIAAVDAGGAGTLKGTQYIQRLNTTGGTAPVGTCYVDAGGATTNVSYTADYYFFGN